MTAISNVDDTDATFDPAFANARVTTTGVEVYYEPVTRTDGTGNVAIRRTVVLKARRMDDRIILWQNDDVVLSRAGALALVTDLVNTLAGA